MQHNEKTWLVVMLWSCNTQVNVSTNQDITLMMLWHKKWQNICDNNKCEDIKSVEKHRSLPLFVSQPLW